MLLSRIWFASILSLVVIFSVAGCAKSEKPEAAAEPVADADHEHMDGEHSHEHDQAAIDAELAKLPPEQKAIADAQGLVCLVSNEPLGAMGPPVLVKDVGGHDFLICCAACEHDLKADPEKYAAKLKKKEPAAEPAKEPAASEPAAEPASKPAAAPEEKKEP